MKIIDAHLHMKRHEGFDNLCKQNGHKNEYHHLENAFSQNDIAGCVIMGNGRHEPDDISNPGLFDLNGEPDFESWNYSSGTCFCIGVSSDGLARDKLEQTLQSYRRAAASPHCAGFKLYLGYQPMYAFDPIYFPVYELAQEMGLTVAFHTGDTANPTGRLKFSHPLTVDEVAVRYPNLRLVLCHFGAPWFLDAAEVVKKNPNVFADLSGLASGIPDTAVFRSRYKGFCSNLENWLEYLDDYGKLLYGSDWPLVNLPAYIKLIESFIPEDEREKVFFENALRVYPALSRFIK